MEFLFALFALPMLVWTVLLLRHGTLLQFSAMVLVAGTFFGPPFFHVDGPFQVSAERVLWAALVGYFGILWLMGKTERLPLSRINIVLIAFCLVTAVSAASAGAAPDGPNPIARWLFYIALPTGLYFVARGTRFSEADFRFLITLLFGVAVYIGAMAVCETKGFHGLVFPRYIVDPKIWEFYGRARGPLLNPAANGVILTIGLGIGLTRWVNAERLGKIGYGLCLLCILAGCYFTLTRCVWIGAFAVIGVMCFQYSPRWLKVWGTISLLLIGGGGGMMFKDQLLRLKRDKELSAEASLKSIELRPLLAIIAIEMFKERPLMGFGYGHYLQNNTEFSQDRTWERPLGTAVPYIQHNILLSVLVDCGLVGLVLYLILLVRWSWTGWSLYMNKSSPPDYRAFGFIITATMIGYVVNGMFQDVTVMPMIHMFLFFLTGILENVMAKCQQAQPGALRNRNAIRQGIHGPSNQAIGDRRTMPAM